MTDTKPDPNAKPATSTTGSSNTATSGLPSATGGWSCQVAQGVSNRHRKKDYANALGTPAFVTRDKRDTMDPKDLEKLVKSMLTPFPTDKFDKVDKVNPEVLDIERIQSSASVAHMLHKVQAHFISYDLGLSFSHFPVVDFSIKDEPTWDLTTTINLFNDFDQISAEVAADTVAFMRESLLDDQLPQELSWTHEFLIACCESASGENSLARIVGGQTDCYKSVNPLQVGGPLTLLLILKQISSSSEKAISDLKNSVPKIKIDSIPGENIDQLCNSLSYVLRRLDTSDMSTLSMDLLKVMQTTSHPAFNKVFESWASFVLLKIAPTPTWDAIFIRAREVYEDNEDTWVSDNVNDGAAAFTAGADNKDSTRKQPGKPTGGSGDDWKKSPWFLFPDVASDTCVLTDTGQKCWSKSINGKPVKWCGKCFSKKYQRRGMWTSNNTHCHFTHEHVTKGSNHSANLATDRSPVEEPAPSDSDASSAAVRPGTSFQDALQQAAEGN